MTVCLPPPLPTEWMSLIKLLEKEGARNRGHTAVGFEALGLLGCCDVVSDTLWSDTLVVHRELTFVIVS